MKLTQRKLSVACRRGSLLLLALAPTAGLPAADVPLPSRLPSVSENVSVDELSQTQRDWQAIVGQPAPARWLRSTSNESAKKEAVRLIGDATNEFQARAWLSAEASAWDALRQAAIAIDLENQSNAGTEENDPAVGRFEVARTAILEARDFLGTYGAVGSDAISRMAKAHRTKLLDNTGPQGISGVDVADRYLDFARVQLAPVAAQSVVAAQSMDLLAAIYLARGDEATLPGPTSLSLRRAALQGQPTNASLASRLGMQLADLGLDTEARWALEHSMSMEFDPQTADVLARVMRRSGDVPAANRLIAAVQQRAGGASTSPINQPRIPVITQLSPQEFASISQPVMPASNSSPGVVRTKRLRNPMSLAGWRMNAATETEEAAVPAYDEALHMAPSETESPGRMRRFLNSFKKIW